MARYVMIVLMFCPIEYLKLKRALRRETKIRQIVMEVLKSPYFHEGVDGMRETLESQTLKAISLEKKTFEAKSAKVVKTGVEFCRKYETLIREIDKIRKLSGDNALRLSRIKTLENAFQKQSQEYTGVKGKYRALEERLGELERKVGLMSQTIESKDMSQTEAIALLRKAVNTLSRQKGADNEVSIGKIKLKDLHTVDDLIRAVRSMDAQTTAIAKKVDAVYNVNKRAGRVAAVKRVKPPKDNTK